MTNPKKGWDFHYLPGTSYPTYVRWVKCGSTSTQDGASTVGGTAKVANGGWVVTGTNFLKGTCAKNWVRPKTASSYGVKMMTTDKWID
jgi:hypothetical protein